MMFCSFYIKNKNLHIDIMFVEITESKIEGKPMTAIFYDNKTWPVKIVLFGAAGCPDYTISSHDEERKKRYIKWHLKTKNWNVYMIAGP